MARAPDPEFRKWVDAARSVPVAEVVEQAGLTLFGKVERVGPCPDCGGRDRFGVNTRKNVWLCRWCRPDGGDVIDLVKLIYRCEFIAACQVLTQQPPPGGGDHGLDLAQLAQLELERAAKRAAQEAEGEKYRQAERARLHSWWRRSLPAAGSPVEDYLAIRGCILPPGDRLRFMPKAKLWADGKRGSKVVHEGWAMAAAIVGPDDRFAGLHLTWLDLNAPDGKLLLPDPETGEFLPAKKVRGSARGGRIELFAVKDPWHVVLGEGIETTDSIYSGLRELRRDLDGVAFWSGYSLGNIGGPHEKNVAHPTEKDKGGRPRRVPGPRPAGHGIPIPGSVRRITLLRDGDSDPFLTDCALERASLRWAAPGREIVVAAARAGLDFNDMRRGRQ